MILAAGGTDRGLIPEVGAPCEEPRREARIEEISGGGCQLPTRLAAPSRRRATTSPAAPAGGRLAVSSPPRSRSTAPGIHLLK